MSHPNILESEAAIAAVLRATRVVAVVGMRDERAAHRASYQIPRAVRALGLRVIPVNPTITSSLGEPSRPDLASVGEPFDMVNVFRRSEAIPGVADEILALPLEKRPRVVWLQSGIRHDGAALKLAEAGIQVVQDRCLAVDAARVLSRSSGER